MAGSLQELQATLASIARKLDHVPFDTIGAELQQVLQNGNKLVKQLDTETAPEVKAMLADARKTLQNANNLIEQLGAETAPEARAALAEVRRTMATIDKAIAPGAPLQRDLQQTLREVSRAANAFRVLSDYLERHPESLLRGKKEDDDGHRNLP
jgi:paraquat-inducible protein B